MNISSNLVYFIKYKNRIEIIREYDNLPQVECYPGQLNQVFMNILTNSILAIEGKGDIQISTSGNDREIIIDFPEVIFAENDKSQVTHGRVGDELLEVRLRHRDHRTVETAAPHSTV